MVRTTLESVWFKYVKVVRPMIEISLVSQDTNTNNTDWRFLTWLDWMVETWCSEGFDINLLR